MVLISGDFVAPVSVGALSRRNEIRNHGLAPGTQYLVGHAGSVRTQAFAFVEYRDGPSSPFLRRENNEEKSKVGASFGDFRGHDFAVREFYTQRIDSSEETFESPTGRSQEEGR